MDTISRKLVLATALTALSLSLGACASNDSVKTFEAQREYYTLPSPGSGPKSVMRHSLRQVAEYDSYKMTRLVNREIDQKEDDADNYLNQVALTLGQTVFIQPDFDAREAALKELKGKIDQEDYVLVLQKAADSLLDIFQSNPSGGDQAGVLVALTNLVTEVRTLKRPELKTILEKIAGANLTITDDAKKYAHDSLQRLTSPSLEARTALQTL